MPAYVNKGRDFFFLDHLLGHLLIMTNLKSNLIKSQINEWVSGVYFLILSIILKKCWGFHQILLPVSFSCEKKTFLIKKMDYVANKTPCIFYFPLVQFAYHICHFQE